MIMAARVQKLTHSGKTIVLVDLSSCQPDEALKQVLPTAKTMIAQSPPKSALILTDVTNSSYTKEVAEALKAWSKSNTPYVKASAVVGADGLRAVLLQTVKLLTRREIKPCKSRDEAMTWLASH
jgi:hypothetical protein